jgi:hypothetical protein
MQQHKMPSSSNSSGRKEEGKVQELNAAKDWNVALDWELR